MTAGAGQAPASQSRWTLRRLSGPPFSAVAQGYGYVRTGDRSTGHVWLWPAGAGMYLVSISAYTFRPAAIRGPLTRKNPVGVVRRVLSRTSEGLATRQICTSR